MRCNWLNRQVNYVGLLVLLLGAMQMARAADLPDFTEIVETQANAVVNISTTRTVTTNGGMGQNQLQDVPPGFQDLFRHFFGEELGDGMPREYDTRSLGSGFVISEDGYIVTNNHVIREADEIIVRFNDGREFNAEIEGADSGSDLALLKINADNLQPVKFGSSDDLKVGEWVLAIGSPFGFEQTVTSGIVSAKGRDLQSERYVPFIQTDVAINPGNSGGPLFNLNGEVVGVNAQIVSRTGGYLGLSFAVPQEVVEDVIHQLQENGRVVRGWLGVSFQGVDHNLADSFGLETTRGALVAEVLTDSPAADAGFEVGDIITEFDGKQVVTAGDLPHFVGLTRPGEIVPVEIIRGNDVRNINVEIGELDADLLAAESSNTQQEEPSSNILGMSVRPYSENELSERSGMNVGVVVADIDRNGPAARAGIQAGDEILRIDNQRIDSVQDFSEVLGGLSEAPITLLIRRGNEGQRFVALQPNAG